MIQFNSLLLSAGIDPRTTRLLRHQDSRSDKDRTPYLLWRNYPDDFITYQSRQRAERTQFFGSAKHWAVFVVSPSRENLFAGLYEVGVSKPADPLAPSVSIPGTLEGEGSVEFVLSKSEALSDYVGKLAIDWGSGALAWAQYAHKNDKRVTAIHPTEPVPDFPGYLRFMKPLSEIPNIYPEWQQRLRDVRGVYVLTSVRDKSLYVGSATGAGGFFERWCEHAKKGGDAVAFRTRETGDYQVSILEVAGSNASERDIVHAEQLWMDKLQTRQMGLNGGRVDDKAI